MFQSKFGHTDLKCSQTLIMLAKSRSLGQDKQILAPLEWCNPSKLRKQASPVARSTPKCAGKLDSSAEDN